MGEARLRFRVVAEGAPVEGAVVRFYLTEFWEVIEEEVREEGFVWEECGVQSGEDGVVEVDLLTGVHEACVTLEGYRTVTFSLLLAEDAELPPINLERGEGFTSLGAIYPESVEGAGGVWRIPLRRERAKLRFKVLAGGEPTGDATAGFRLVVPLFWLLECLRKIAKGRKEGYVLLDWRVKVGEGGLVEEELPPGLYGVRVSMRGYRGAIFGVCLTGDMELPPIELKRGEGKPTYLGIFLGRP
ncbi:MAG: hypothetical protein QXH81_07070 [Thermofilaceae archaeon]